MNDEARLIVDFEEMQEKFRKKEKTSMTEVIDYYINLGEERGVQKGVLQGMQQGIQQGIQQKETDAIEKMAAYFRQQDATLTQEQAEEMARNILR